MNNKKALDQLILKFLRDNSKDEFKVDQLRELIGKNMKIQDIRRSLGRLRKKKLVSRRQYSSGARQWRAK